jgi:hypothetical protein
MYCYKFLPGRLPNSSIAWGRRGQRLDRNLLIEDLDIFMALVSKIHRYNQGLVYCQVSRTLKGEQMGTSSVR